jgi:hypothetical protein
MKFSFPSVTLALVASLATVKAENPLTCLTSVDPDVDYFPDKVQPLDSVLWSIEYANTYKTLFNIAANETYLLYQCGSEPPADQLDGRHAAVVSIPLLGGVAITQTPMIAYLEQLGLMEEISVFISNPDTISSPCLKGRVDAGDVRVLQDASASGIADSSTDFGADAVSNADLSSTVAFVSPFDSDLPFDTKIVISASSEGPNAAIFEWVDFYAAFFNKEALANQVVDAANSRFDCIAGNAGLIRSDSPDKPVVLWATYSDYCAGWSVAKCGGRYYCEFADACGADILSSTEGSITACGGFTYMTVEEIVELGKDADFWIYPDRNWDKTFVDNAELLNTMKSVQNKEVYDFQGEGSSGWFEQRLAEYYEVLDDFCTIVGTTTIFDRERKYFRNVFDEMIGGMGQCINPSSSSILNDVHSCVPDVITDQRSGPDDSAATLTAGTGVVGLVLAFVSLHLV